ncbi:MAG: hemolysin family protein [Muribaculaceae bacterium]|nr:HlyC/CorC family transporter [Bacteroidales bacterium]MDE6243209.1 hemolysin family protein [Muribaculaceae bacterium]
MEQPLAIIITVLAILLSGFFSGTEIAFVQSSKVRIGIDERQGGIISRIIGGFTRHQDMFISTILVGNNIVLVIYGIAISIIINPWLEAHFQNEALVLICNTLISTTIILIAGEFLPKTLFRINPNTMLKVFAIPTYIIYLLLYPVSLFASGLSKLLMKVFGIKEEKTDETRLTIDQIDHFVQQAIDEKKEGEDVENEVKIFRNALDFKDTHIHDCMIPRNEIVAVNIDTTSRSELTNLFITTGLSKIVVYRDDIDEVLGYIHVSELFNADADWKNCLKPVIFTPETMLANKMMHRLMAEKKSMAIVVDEFGGTAGLVTLEDLVEEIFGEIEDEHDRSRKVARMTAPGCYELSGRAEIQAVNEEFNLDIKESEDYHTIAGFILHNLEALPKQGDSFNIGRFKFDILRMTATKIELVSMELLNQEEED